MSLFKQTMLKNEKKLPEACAPLTKTPKTAFLDSYAAQRIFSFALHIVPFVLSRSPIFDEIFSIFSLRNNRPHILFECTGSIGALKAKRKTRIVYRQ